MNDDNFDSESSSVDFVDTTTFADLPNYLQIYSKFDDLISICNVLYAKNDLLECKQSCLYTLSKHPSRIEPLFLLSLIYEDEKDSENLLVILLKIIKRKKTDFDTIKKAYTISQSLKKYEISLRLLTKLQKIHDCREFVFEKFLIYKNLQNVDFAVLSIFELMKFDGFVYSVRDFLKIMSSVGAKRVISKISKIICERDCDFLYVKDFLSVVYEYGLINCFIRIFQKYFRDLRTDQRMMLQYVSCKLQFQAKEKENNRAYPTSDSAEGAASTDSRIVSENKNEFPLNLKKGAAMAKTENDFIATDALFCAKDPHISDKYLHGCIGIQKTEENIHDSGSVDSCALLTSNFQAAYSDYRNHQSISLISQPSSDIYNGIAQNHEFIHETRRPSCDIPHEDDRNHVSMKVIQNLGNRIAHKIDQDNDFLCPLPRFTGILSNKISQDDEPRHLHQKFTSDITQEIIDMFQAITDVFYVSNDINALFKDKIELKNLKSLDTLSLNEIRDQLQKTLEKNKKSSSDSTNYDPSKAQDVIFHKIQESNLLITGTETCAHKIEEPNSQSDLQNFSKKGLNNITSNLKPHVHSNPNFSFKASFSESIDEFDPGNKHNSSLTNRESTKESLYGRKGDFINEDLDLSHQTTIKCLNYLRNIILSKDPIFESFCTYRNVSPLFDLDNSIDIINYDILCDILEKSHHIAIDWFVFTVIIKFDMNNPLQTYQLIKAKKLTFNIQLRLILNLCKYLERLGKFDQSLHILKSENRNETNHSLRYQIRRLNEILGQSSVLDDELIEHKREVDSAYEIRAKFLDTIGIFDNLNVEGERTIVENAGLIHNSKNSNHSFDPLQDFQVNDSRIHENLDNQGFKKKSVSFQEDVFDILNENDNILDESPISSFFSFEKLTGSATQMRVALDKKDEKYVSNCGETSDEGKAHQYIQLDTQEHHECLTKIQSEQNNILGKSGTAFEDAHPLKDCKRSQMSNVMISGACHKQNSIYKPHHDPNTLQKNTISSIDYFTQNTIPSIQNNQRLLNFNDPINLNANNPIHSILNDITPHYLPISDYLLQLFGKFVSSSQELLRDFFSNTYVFDLTDKKISKKYIDFLQTKPAFLSKREVRKINLIYKQFHGLHLKDWFYLLRLNVCALVQLQKYDKAIKIILLTLESNFKGRSLVQYKEYFEGFAGLGLKISLLNNDHYAFFKLLSRLTNNHFVIASYFSRFFSNYRSTRCFDGISRNLIRLFFRRKLDSEYLSKWIIDSNVNTGKDFSRNEILENLSQIAEKVNDTDQMSHIENIDRPKRCKKRMICSKDVQTHSESKFFSIANKEEESEDFSELNIDSLGEEDSFSDDSCLESGGNMSRAPKEVTDAYHAVVKSIEDESNGHFSDLIRNYRQILPSLRAIFVAAHYPRDLYHYVAEFFSKMDCDYSYLDGTLVAVLLLRRSFTKKNPNLRKNANESIKIFHRMVKICEKNYLDLYSKHSHLFDSQNFESSDADRSICEKAKSQELESKSVMILEDNNPSVQKGESYQQSEFQKGLRVLKNGHNTNRKNLQFEKEIHQKVLGFGLKENAVDSDTFSSHVGEFSKKFILVPDDELSFTDDATKNNSDQHSCYQSATKNIYDLWKLSPYHIQTDNFETIIELEDAYEELISSYYNLARAFHTTGFPGIAENLYKMCCKSRIMEYMAHIALSQIYIASKDEVLYFNLQQQYSQKL